MKSYVTCAITSIQEPSHPSVTSYKIRPFRYKLNSESPDLLPSCMFEYKSIRIIHVNLFFIEL